MFAAANQITPFGSVLAVRAVGSAAKFAGMNIWLETSTVNESGYSKSGKAAGTALSTGATDPTEVGIADLLPDELFRIFAVGPGTYPMPGTANEIQILIFTSETYAAAANFNINNPPTAADEFVIVVVDGGGTILEVNKVSRIKTKTDMYGSMYLMDRINNTSQYIYVIDNTNIPVMSGGDYNLPVSSYSSGDLDYVDFGGGVDSPPAYGDIINAYAKCSNKALYNYLGILSIGNNELEVHQALIEQGTSYRTRVFLDTPFDVDTVEDAVNYRLNVLASSSNRTALYFDWQNYYDAMSSKYILCPPTVFVGAALAYANKFGYPWTAPAGYQFGQLFNAVSARTELQDSDLSVLCSNQINPLANIPGLGRLIWGDFTLQPFLSALQFIGARTALDLIEDAVQKIGNTVLLRPNTRSTRNILAAGINPIIRTMANLGALQKISIVDVSDGIQTSDSIINVNLPVYLTESVRGIQVNIQVVRGSSVNISEQQV